MDHIKNLTFLIDEKILRKPNFKINPVVFALGTVVKHVRQN
jgi:hypothetical protein